MNAATPCCKTPESLRAFTLMKWLVLLGALVLLLLCWQLGWCEGEWHPSGAPRLASVAAPVVAPVLAPIAPPPAPAVLQSALVSAQWQDGKVKLVGTVASADDKAKAFEAAKQAFGAEKVADELQVKDGYKGIEWIELSGEAATQTERAAAEASVREAFVGLAGAQLRVDNRMTIKASAAPVAPPVAPIAAMSDECVSAMKATLKFFMNSAVLTLSDKDKLNAMLPCMKEGKFEIAGHTDNVGADQRNQQLSETRAKVAKTYLVQRGIAEEAIGAAGYGMTKPVTSNDTIEGRRENRRVEVLRQ